MPTDPVTTAHTPRHPLLVSFSGIDGAGKSTQIAHLREQLDYAGQRVQQIIFWDDVACLKWMREGAGHTLFRGDKGVGTPEAPIQRRDKNVRSPLMTMVRMGLYLIDAFSLRRIARAAGRSDADVVIFDRYLYDELANLNLRNRAARWFIRCLLALVPHPHLAFVLDADPVQARARKPEYPLDFLILNRRAYLELGEFLGGIIIPPLPLPQAKAAVMSHVLPRLRSAIPPRSIAGHGAGQQSLSQKKTDGQSARPVAS